jgi:hypothetical protein
MSEILARLRVRETHGIRRFLYPLTAYVALPPDTHLQRLRLSDGENDLPLQVTHTGTFRLDFAVSLDPHAARELMLTEGQSAASLDDPLCLTKEGSMGLLINRQKRFQVVLHYDGTIREVVYDSITLLRNGLRIFRNDEPPIQDGDLFYHAAPDFSTVTAWTGASRRYPDGVACSTDTEIIACKSWATVTHEIREAKPNDEIAFTLPLAITSPTLTCDFGVGGSVFGKLDEKAPEIVWRTKFGDAPYARWTVATAGRTDYIGEVATAETFLPQRWFHLIDSDKALAVAITQVPPDCREMTVRLTHEGDVSVTFRLGDTITGPAEFGVCYHFLNDVPAIAAATNPQSILLPPVVEVLPV